MEKQESPFFVRAKDVQEMFGGVSRRTAEKRMRLVREKKGKEKGYPITKQDIKDVFKL